MKIKMVFPLTAMLVVASSATSFAFETFKYDGGNQSDQATQALDNSVRVGKDGTVVYRDITNGATTVLASDPDIKAAQLNPQGHVILVGTSRTSEVIDPLSGNVLSVTIDSETGAQVIKFLRLGPKPIRLPSRDQ